jgi:hypothetical protein
MDMALKMGSFCELDESEAITIDGGSIWGVIGGVALGALGVVVIVGSVVGGVAAVATGNPIVGIVGVAGAIGGVYTGVQMFSHGLNIAENAWNRL